LESHPCTNLYPSSEPLHQARKPQQALTPSLQIPHLVHLAPPRRPKRLLLPLRSLKRKDDLGPKQSPSHRLLSQPRDRVRILVYLPAYLIERSQPTPRIAKPKVLTNHPHNNTRTLLLLLQTAYIYFLTTYPNDLVTLAANLGSHFILNNVLLSALILLWVHARFLLAEAFLILNFLNLTSLYFRHHKTPLFVHYPVVTGPLCFTFVALFVNGAVVVGSNSLGARICANVAVWCVLVYGMFFLIAFRDCAIGMELSVLCLGKIHRSICSSLTVREADVSHQQRWRYSNSA